MSAAPAAMPSVTAQDLELEHAELLPGRETLYCCKLMPWDGRAPMWRE